jgi:hypothetical protein
MVVLAVVLVSVNGGAGKVVSLSSVDEPRQARRAMKLVGTMFLSICRQGHW